MKKKLLIAALVAVLAVLFIPWRVEVLDDGGTRDFRSLTYRVTAWKRMTDDGTYKKLRVYFGADVFRNISDLWAREEPYVEHCFVAKVVELKDGTALVEPVEYEYERSAGDLFSIDVRDLADIGAEAGSFVQVTYRGAIRETYPVSVDAVGWEMAADLRHMEYTGTWLDQETTESAFMYSVTLEITKIYSNCFFGQTIGSYIRYPCKINGTLSEEWCVGDTVRVSCEKSRLDGNYRYEADMVRVSAYEKQQDDLTADKPVIYLYPQEEMEVSLRLDLDGRLTCTYPAYGDGWTVTARPDGTLTDGKGQSYNYLYWEGQTDADYDLTQGFCVKGEDTAAFLEEALEKLGLTRREANEFIVYWLPLMEQNAYNIISFQTDRYTDTAKLEITPSPDTLIRVFMAWQAAEEYVELPEQTLTAPERRGFTAVEWGGTEIP